MSVQQNCNSPALAKLPSAYAPQGISWSTLLDAARSYAVQGFTVVPVSRNKSPVGYFSDLTPENCLRNLEAKSSAYDWLYSEYAALYASGSQRSEADNKALQTKQRQLEKYPIVGIGLRTGLVNHPKANSFIVIDLDVKPSVNGVKNFQELCARLNVDLPVTMHAQSGSGGGRHYYFQYEARFAPLKQNVNIEGLAIDTRLNNCIIVVAPSPWFLQLEAKEYEFDGRAYRWIEGRAPGECPMARLPEALFAWIQDQQRSQIEEKKRPVGAGGSKSKRLQIDQQVAGQCRLTDMLPVVKRVKEISQ